MKLWAIILFVISFVTISLLALFQVKQDTVKIGLLYSQTGTMKTEEAAIAQILRYQVQLLNLQGGLLNKRIELVEYDGASNDQEFAKGAQFLIDQGITTIFGCWTSASRRAVKPIIEKADAILFYPVQYEGLESSENIYYLGSTPSQQINPMITFVKQNYGSRIYVVGSNYIYPRISGLYLSEMAHLLGLEIIGEDYFPLGSESFSEVVETIQKKQPDAIINLLNGESNIAFFETLNQCTDCKKHPVFSTSLDERSLTKIIHHLPENALDGHYLSGSYFHNILSDKNYQLINDLRQHFGEDFLLTDASFNTLIAFEFWQRAVNDQGSFETKKIRASINGDGLNSANGIVYIDQKNNHIHKPMRIAQIHNNQLEIVWTSEIMANPNPYPIMKTSEFWQGQLNELYRSWDKRWQSDEIVSIGD